MRGRLSQKLYLHLQKCCCFLIKRVENANFTECVCFFPISSVGEDCGWRPSSTCLSIPLPTVPLRLLSLSCCLEAESEDRPSLWGDLVWAMAGLNLLISAPRFPSQRRTYAFQSPAGSGYSPSVWNNFWKGPHLPVDNPVPASWCFSSWLWAAAGGKHDCPTARALPWAIRSPTVRRSLQWGAPGRESKRFALALNNKGLNHL